MPQRVFEKYEIVRRIAVGGMGEVFLARQLGAAKFERQVILKAMLSEKSTPLLASRFLDEARLVATLNHPNVVSVFEAGLSDGTFYMAMEYIAGWNLAQLQKEASELPLGLVVRVIHDAALGLDHAHHAVDANGRLQQIVHRDVSPHNIMLRRDGVTKVVDFGVAWALNRDAKTQTGAVVGKVAYMAPEQLMGEATDARTDQFALGVVAWELLTRRRLHVGVNELEVAKLVLTARIPHPSDVASDVPRPLGDIVLRMLAEAPDRRFARLQDVAIELERAGRTLQLDTSTATLET
ncbi:MAG: serine/threonine protein kinase, partial [Archangium sp.]|nr:serine/threonine protein kinase [Archangium sp.]